MPRRELTLVKDVDAIERLVRMLGASVNVALFSALLAARKRGDGWVGLSELAKVLGEAPGTVSVAVQKMLPVLVEDKYEKGRRYFRARVAGLRVVLEDAPPNIL